MMKLKLFLYSLGQMISYLLTFKRRVLYIGGYPTISNVGDVALWKAYEEFFPTMKVIHFRGGKIENTFYRLFSKPKDIAVLAGGTLINHMCLREAQDAFNVLGPFYVLGTGVAQSSYWKGREGYTIQEGPWKELLLQSPFVGVRGRLSQGQLLEFGVESFVFGDPVLYLSETRSLGNKEFFGEEMCIGLNVGRSLGHVQGGEENLKDIFIQSCLKLKESGYSFKWFVVCPEDLEVTMEVQGLVGGRVVQIYKDYRDYYRELEDCRLFLGTKLHAVCLATCRSIPSIMIEYRPKCRDFMDSIGLGDYSIPADKCNVDKVTDTILELERSYQEIVFLINKNIDEIKLNQMSVIEGIVQKESLL